MHMTADATDQLRGAKVLITGGAGFIGSTLAARLVDDNRITIYDNFARDALSSTSRPARSSDSTPSGQASSTRP